MKRQTNFVLWLLILYGVVAGCQPIAQVEKNEDLQDGVAHLLGDWSGESICVNKEKFPACKDEVVIYHITKVADKPNTVNLSADKIVDGKPEFMGAFDCIYDAKKQT